MEMAETQKITLKLSPQARRYVGRDAPLEARRTAARGALPLPPVDLAAVLFALMHDPDAEVKSTARQSLENLPRGISATVISSDSHPALLSHLAHTHKDDGELMEQLALNAAASDGTFVFLASLPHRRVVEIVANNQQRLLRCSEIVDALGDNPLTSRSVIDRVLFFLGIERPAAEVADEPDAFAELPEPEPVTDDDALAALRAVLGDDAADLARELVDELEGEIDEQERTNLLQLVQTMTVIQKIKLARMGNAEARGLLVRDHNKIVATAAVRSPKLTDNEVAHYAKMRNVCEEVLRVIGSNREFTRNYQTKLALATNPKTPQATAMKFLNYLQEKDLRSTMKSKDVPTAISTHARRILTKKGKL
jgi:hypothetical protein